MACLARPAQHAGCLLLMLENAITAISCVSRSLRRAPPTLDQLWGYYSPIFIDEEVSLERASHLLRATQQSGD